MFSSLLGGTASLLLLLGFLWLASAAFTEPQQLWKSSSSRSSSARPPAVKSILRPQEDEEEEDDDTVLLFDMVRRMTRYFGSMVDDDDDDDDPTTTRRFYALSRPPSGERIRANCPVRDLGVAWDATQALLFWKEQQQQQGRCFQDDEPCRRRLEEAVLGTLQVYNASYIPVAAADDGTTSGALALDPDILREPPNVAHSAFCLLASIGALRLSLLRLEHDDDDDGETTKRRRPPPVDALTRGILAMQRDHDGAFRVEFGSDDICKMVAFYPGEAMVALMEVYDVSGTATRAGVLDGSTRRAILPAMQRAFRFYADFYHQNDLDANYNIWQVQAFARLFFALHDGGDSEHENYEQNNNNGNNVVAASAVADYVLELCRGIVESRSWKELARRASFYPNLETVEIACGLDAVVQGIRVASTVTPRDDAEEERLLFGTHAQNAVEFLKAAQDRVPPEATVGSGGLGYGGIQVLEQRLDVTGHALAALTKLLQVKQDIWAPRAN